MSWSRRSVRVVKRSAPQKSRLEQNIIGGLSYEPPLFSLQLGIIRLKRSYFSRYIFAAIFASFHILPHSISLESSVGERNESVCEVEDCSSSMRLAGNDRPALLFVCDERLKWDRKEVLEYVNGS